ncbi:MAG: hypothetical protein AAF741_19010 [Bacteroidota bacterium]
MDRPHVQLSVPYPLKIRGDNQCYLYVKSLKEATPPTVIYAKDNNGALYQSDPIEENYYRFTNLPDNATFKVLAFGEEGQVFSGPDFVTNHLDGDFIPVDATFYRTFRSWIKRGDFNKTGQFSAVLSVDAPEFAIASFVQRYYYKGADASSVMELLNPISIGSQARSNEGCECEGVSVPPNFIFDPGFVPANGTSATISPGLVTYVTDSRKLEYYTQNAGPAKMWFGYSDGWREDRNEWWGRTIGYNPTNEDGPGGGGNMPIPDNTQQTGLGQRAIQSFLLFCNGGTFEIPDCDCTKDIRIGWGYNSSIDVRAQLGSASGSKRSIAIGEDIAVAWSVQERVNEEPVFDFIAGINNMEGISCTQDPNPAYTSGIVGFFGSLGLLAAGAVTFGNALDDISGPAQVAVINLGANLTNQAVQSAGNWLSNSPTVTTGNCPNIITQNIPQRFDEQKIYQLRPNMSLQAGIAARTTMVSRGMRSWQSEVTIRSNFRLQAFLPADRNTSDPGSDCCLPRMLGYYWNKTLPQPPNNMINFQPQLSFAPPIPESEIREDIASFFIAITFGNPFSLGFNQMGQYTVSNDFGILRARKLDAALCALEVGPGVPFPEDPRPDPPIGPQIEVLDMSGRLVGSTILPSGVATKYCYL